MRLLFLSHLCNYNYYGIIIIIIMQCAVHKGLVLNLRIRTRTIGRGAHENL